MYFNNKLARKKKIANSKYRLRKYSLHIISNKLSLKVCLSEIPILKLLRKPKPPPEKRIFLWTISVFSPSKGHPLASIRFLCSLRCSFSAAVLSAPPGD